MLLLVAISFASVFLLVISVGSLLGLSRHPIDQRIQDMQSGERHGINSAQQREHIKNWMTQFGKTIAPKNEKDRSDCKNRLHLAGYYAEPALNIYWGIRISLTLLLPAITAFFFSVGNFESVQPLWFILSSAGIGFIAPDVFLYRKKKARHEHIFCGLPDALDFLVVCL